MTSNREQNELLLAIGMKRFYREAEDLFFSIIRRKLNDGNFSREERMIVYHSLGLGGYDKLETKEIAKELGMDEKEIQEKKDHIFTELHRTVYYMTERFLSKNRKAMLKMIGILENQIVRLERRVRSYETQIIQHSVPSDERVREVILNSYIAEIPIEELKLPKKTINLLRSQGVQNIGELANHRSRIGIGRKTEIEIRDALNEFGLALK